MRNVDYIGNLARLSVELVNGDPPSGLRWKFATQHRIRPVRPEELDRLLPVLAAAVAAVADAGPPDAVNALLERYPPRLRVSDHDGAGAAHLHFAADGEDPARWLGRSCAAALAHIACGDPAVAVGRCRAAGCRRFFVDDSRNRSRRFCSNACASRTTVAAHRARRRAGG